MKILFVCSSVGGGGAERVATNLANALARKDHLITIFSRRMSEKSYSIDGRIFLISPERESFFKCIFALKKAIDLGEYDAVISFTDVQNILTYIASIICEKSVFFVPTIHTNLEARDSHIKPGFRVAAVKFLHKLACRSARKVIAVSEGAKESLCAYYNLAESQAMTIYNPVISDSEIIVSRKKNPPKNEIKLVAAGRLTEAKNYQMMIEVVRRLNEVSAKYYTLDIYGVGECSENLRLYAVQCGVEGQIFFRGFVANLKSRLADYDVFLFTSDWEGFGNVLVEALTAGIPVVSTDCPSGPGEILERGRFGRLISVGDIEGFAEAVEDETVNPLEISPEALSTHLEKFRENVVGQKYIELVKNA